MSASIPWEEIGPSILHVVWLGALVAYLRRCRRERRPSRRVPPHRQWDKGDG